MVCIHEHMSPGNGHGVALNLLPNSRSVCVRVGWCISERTILAGEMIEKAFVLPLIHTAGVTWDERDGVLLRKMESAFHGCYLLSYGGS